MKPEQVEALLQYRLHQTHDYGEMVEIDQPTAGQTLADAEAFVTAVETYLYSAGHLTSEADKS